ncbi:WCX domain-containing protein [Streptomyces lasiicapitis]
MRGPSRAARAGVGRISVGPSSRPGGKDHTAADTNRSGAGAPTPGRSDRGRPFRPLPGSRRTRGRTARSARRGGREAGPSATTAGSRRSSRPRSTAHACGELLRLGIDVEVVAPPELRRAMAGTVAAPARTYGVGGRPV